MLKPISFTQPKNESPLIRCDACGTEKPSHFMMNVIINAPSPGHPSLVGIGCDEHWACSLECWGKVAHACIDEHMIQRFNHAHKKIKG